ncbi:MAG: carboxypeptidase regulatory-like domain-containing protein, partial [Acidobacteriota bacterium]
MSVFGQSVTSLNGRVTDPAGAAIPDAAVELENTATGVKRSASTDHEGLYWFQQVAPGDYKVTVRAKGFSSKVVSDLRLLVNSPATINVQLEIGAVTETVSVMAEAVQVNTTDASLGHAIGTKPILQLPLNARNIAGLLAVQPGVVFTTEGDTDSRNGAVSGGKSDQANVTLDGVDVNDQMDRNAFTSVLRVTPDSVQEFRFTTMNANADSGRTSGAQITMVTKRGTNELHGSLYEYHRNTATTANGFFNNLSGVERPKLIRNIFGASAGGPLWKNRLFLFTNYEGRRDRRDGSATRSVPSMDMRQGILHYQRRDGSIANVTPADLARLLDPRGANQAALAVLQKYPTPNDFTVGDNLNIVGFRFNAPTPLRWNTYIMRLDYVLDQASKHTAFFRGNLQNDNAAGMPQFPGQPPNSVNL